MRTAEDLFAEGLSLEEDPKTQKQALEAYKSVVALKPEHAGAHINIGTLYYNKRDLESAEMHYRLALAADDKYTLAWFDLGNCLDETGRVEEAIEAYAAAVRLSPAYADAHYNLALSYEKRKTASKALKHWNTYIKLDPSGPWSQHAKGQVSRIVRSSGLAIAINNGRASKTGAAKLSLVKS